MGYFTVHFLRVDDASREDARDEFRLTSEKNGFAVSDTYRSFEPGPAGLEKLSRRFTEVFCMGVQSNVCGFFYEHWLRGERARGLAFTPEMGGWYSVAGSAEAWEAELLFAESTLARQREHAARFNPSAVPKIDAVIAKKSLAEGDRWPDVDGDGLIRAVVDHWKLPRFLGF